MAIRLDRVSLAYGNGGHALGPIDLVLAPGERIAVIGPSGAGKTSLVRLVGTSLRPTSGRLQVLANDPWALRPAALRRLRARIGVVHQAAPIPGRLRVITAVLAGRLGQWSAWRAALSLLRPVDIEGARAALARLDLEARLFERCDRLSGGQLQRVGVARTLYQAPDLVIADEPVSALDPALADMTVGELVRDADERGATLVASLHAVDLALKWFPRVIGLKHGAIAFDRPSHEVTTTMLRELYLVEGAALPLHIPGDAPAASRQRATEVAPPRRPLCS